MTTQSMLSTPALILTIGTSMASAIAEVEHIFFQSDPRRRAATVPATSAPRARSRAGVVTSTSSG